MAKALIADTGKFQLEVEDSEKALVFRPIGLIDEDVNFSAALDAARSYCPNRKAPAFEFDLGRVSRMNSCGIREWLLLIERMETLAPCSFRHVTELFVDQANMIPAMFGKKSGEVVSFYAPYHCPACNRDETILLAPKQVEFKGEEALAPVEKCSKCGKRMDFGWLPEEYFSFLQRSKA